MDVFVHSFEYVLLSSEAFLVRFFYFSNPRYNTHRSALCASGRGRVWQVEYHSSTR